MVAVHSAKRNAAVLVASSQKQTRPHSTEDKDSGISLLKLKVCFMFVVCAILASTGFTVRVEIGVIVCLHGVAAPTLASDTDHVNILVKASQM